jgi:hypothetical protein
LRFGDLIKSNYSKFNLQRLFGVGTTAWKVSKDDNHQQEVAEWLKKSKAAKSKAAKYTTNATTEPLDPEAGGKTGGFGSSVGDAFGIGNAGNSSFPEVGYVEGDVIISKTGIREWLREPDGAKIKKNPHKRKIKTKALRLKVTGFKWSRRKVRITKAEKQKWDLGNKPPKKKRRKIQYICEITEPEAIKWIPKKYGQEFRHLVLYHDQIQGLHPSMIDYIWKEDMGEASGGPGESAGSETDPSEIMKKTAEFFQPENNFIVKAFESTRGRGMAGVITALSFDWGEATWETTPGRRAPQWLKVSITFDPIHDLPMGLDYDGAMNAPAYNVGKIVEHIGGDPYYPTARHESNRNNTYFSDQSKKPGETPEGPEKDDAGDSGSGLPF